MHAMQRNRSVPSVHRNIDIDSELTRPVTHPHRPYI